MLRFRLLYQRVTARIGRADRAILLGLFLGPVLAVVPFSLAGHPIMPGDDLLQNFPLRVLAGRLIASGKIPAWDPFIWSGTPLLGGWNAGAMFPGTWLFAFLPAIAAWTINFCSVPVAASIGLYLFARRALRLRPSAALFSALVFTYTGYVVGQTVHLGLEQGAAVVPWVLLGIDGTARAHSVRARVGYGILIASGLALCVLAGDPRAISNAGFIVVVYLAALVLRHRRESVATVLSVIVAALVAVLVSAVQWLPGLSFLSSSQRQSTGYAFYGAGSLDVFHQVADFTVPFLSGGSGNLGLPIYLGNYNIPEVTIGVGYIALVAALSYLPEILACTGAWLSRRPSPRTHRLGVWFVLLVVGVALTAGSSTPLGHALFAIPLFNGERLQNRNIFIADLALSILLGYFLDDLATSNAAIHRARRPVWHARDGLLARLFALLPSLAALVLVSYAFIRPVSLEAHLGFLRVEARFFDRLSGYLIATVVLAAVVAIVVLFQRLLSPRARFRIVLVLVALDVCTYMLNEGIATTPSSAIGGPTQTSRAIARLLGSSGRYALFNPGFENPRSGAAGLTTAGVADLAIIQGNPSVQGYGSILDNDYEYATGTHMLEYLAVDRLSLQTFDTLDLTDIVTLPSYLSEPLPAHSAIPVEGGPAATATGLPGPTTDAPALPPKATGPWTIAPGATAQFFLPYPISLVRTTVVATSADGTRLRVGSSGPHQKTEYVEASFANREIHASFATRGRVELVLVNNPTATPVTIGAVVVVTRNPALRLLLSGALQGGLHSPQWAWAKRIGSYEVFVNRSTHGFAWLQPLETHTPETTLLARGSVRLLDTSALAPQRFIVNATTAARLVRSETYEPGWTATLVSTTTHTTITRPVGRFGLVQSIVVPPGRYLLTWHYAPSELNEGFAGSSLGTMIVLAGLVYLWRSGRRRRLVRGRVAEGAVRETVGTDA